MAADTLDSLVIHPQTRSAIEQYLAKPSHALIIVGRDGSGKEAVAALIVSHLMSVEALGDPSQFSQIDARDGIDAIRGLQHIASLRSVNQGPSEIKRVAQITHAEALSIEAQNALLKLLEEPPEGMVLLLLTLSKDLLLSTILSRSRLIALRPPSREALESHFATTADKKIVSRAVMMAGNLPGLTSRILTADEDDLYSQAAVSARQILAATGFERLTQVDVLNKQRDLAEQTIFMVARMAEGAIEQLTKQPVSGISLQKLKNWQNVLECTHKAIDRMVANTQLKLLLTEWLTAL